MDEIRRLTHDDGPASACGIVTRMTPSIESDCRTVSGASGRAGAAGRRTRSQARSRSPARNCRTTPTIGWCCSEIIAVSSLSLSNISSYDSDRAARDCGRNQGLRLSLRRSALWVRLNREWLCKPKSFGMDGPDVGIEDADAEVSPSQSDRDQRGDQRLTETAFSRHDGNRMRDRACLKASGCGAGWRSSFRIGGMEPESRASRSAATIGSGETAALGILLHRLVLADAALLLQPKPKAFMTSAATGSCATSSLMFVCG